MTLIISGDSDGFYGADTLIIDLNSFGAASPLVTGFWNSGFGTNSTGTFGVDGDSRRQNKTRMTPPTKNWVAGVLTSLPDTDSVWNGYDQRVNAQSFNSPSGNGSYPAGELFPGMDNLIYYSKNGLYSQCVLASYLESTSPTDLQGNNTLVVSGGVTSSTETFYPEDLLTSLDFDGTGKIDIDPLSYVFTQSSYAIAEVLFRPTDLTTLPQTVMEIYQDADNYVKIYISNFGNVKVKIVEATVTKADYDTGEVVKINEWNWVWFLNQGNNGHYVKVNYSQKLTAAIFGGKVSSLNKLRLGMRQDDTEVFIGQMQSLRGLDSPSAEDPPSITGNKIAEIPTAPPGVEFATYFFTFNKPAPRIFGIAFSWQYDHSTLFSIPADQSQNKGIEFVADVFAITEGVADASLLDNAAINSLSKVAAQQNPIVTISQLQAGDTVPDSQSIEGFARQGKALLIANNQTEYVPFSFPANTKIFGFALKISVISDGLLSDYSESIRNVEISEIKGTNFL